ncbi:MAG: HD domain-containing protein [Halobacteriovoraceae bacterium]|nr:HD domain-containing protein [Halobacteriovoraceae bacterium]
MKKVFVEDLQSKADVNELFLIKYLSVMQGRDGRSYLNIILTDRTGDLESRKWNTAEKTAEKINRGDYARVTGKINTYQGRNQLVVKEIYSVDPSDINEDDFIAKSQKNSTKMFDELHSIINELNDVYIKELLQKVLNDPKIFERLLKWQAGKSVHHAYEGGLLEHILSCTQLAIWLSAHYQVNKNFVVAGAIMHDLCKIFELTAGPLCDYTDHGRLVGHLSNGVELIEKYTSQIEGFPSDTKMHLKHILLSHHGEYEYGSPKLPQTSEAFLVHLIDLMDSKMNSMEQVKRTDNLQGPWSNFIKHLDRTVFKSELPLYTQKVSPTQKDNSTLEKDKKKSNNSDLTYTLADKLAGFKIEDME